MLTRLRTDVLKALWGNRRQMRCPEVVFTLLVRGHLADPIQADLYKSLVTFRTMMCQRMDLREFVITSWQVYQHSRKQMFGPVGKLAHVTDYLGWAWTEPFGFQNAQGVNLDML
eukprot:5820313-Karenia_brevis.AAC.1